MAATQMTKLACLGFQCLDFIIASIVRFLVTKNQLGMGC